MGATRWGKPWLSLTALIVVIGLGSACSREPDVSRLAFPGAVGSAQPRLTSDLDGAPLMSWLEPAGEETALKYARFDGQVFGEPGEVVRSDRMFVNWADFPSVTPISDDLWFAHWLKRQPGSSNYDIAAMISVDGGVSWTEAEQMNEDETEAEHGFVSVFPWNEGIAAFWLDGRELANWSFDDPDALLGVSLRFARYDAGGTVTERRIFDELVCDCCQPDVAMTPAGPLVIYRNRTEDEIRDVVVRRYLDGAWSDAVDLGKEGWHIEGCPVNGPVIAARDGEVVAVWYTAGEGRPRVRMARSADSGASFAPAVDVDARGALGQTGVVIGADGRAVISWWRRNMEQGGIDLIVRAYERDGSAGDEVLVAHESIGQVVDVPQIIAAGDAYLVAWTTLDDDGDVRLARLEL
jgi:hypothetical protein